MHVAYSRGKFAEYLHGVHFFTGAPTFLQENKGLTHSWNPCGLFVRYNVNFYGTFLLHAESNLSPLLAIHDHSFLSEVEYGPQPSVLSLVDSLIRCCIVASFRP